MASFHNDIKEKGPVIENSKNDPLTENDEIDPLNSLSLRLSPHVRPMNYNVTLYPHFDSSNFNGNVKIKIETKEDRNFLALNSNFLNINSVKVTNDTQEFPVTKYFLVKKLEQLIIVFENKLITGIYEIIIDFTGSLTGDLVGLYSARLKNNTRMMVASKFQPTYARQAFPCFDEPDFKATFDITLVKPKHLIALSNMNIKSVEPDGPNTDMVTFATSLPMSTYLASFVICDFEFQEVGINSHGIGHNFVLRTFAQKSEIYKIDFALEIGRKATEFYIKYYQVPFPLPKLDMIGIPNYISGATEHWGMITFRETAFLIDKNEASSLNRINVAGTIAHELAHMWFGNLVTIKWWDDIWLNEGFATFMQFKALDFIEPKWDMLNQFLVKVLHPVLDTDSGVSSHPIVQTVSTPDDITAMFDSISYYKGASIVRMLEHFIGIDNFRIGISDYLMKYQFQNTETQDLLNSLNIYLTQSYPYLNLVDVMNTWMTQPGYPLVTLEMKEDGRTCVISHKQFMIDPEINTDTQTNGRWFVPVTFKTNREESLGVVWLPNTDDKVTVKLSSKIEWIKLNVNQIGYYRVNYPITIWERLISLLKNKSPKLSVADRANLLNDVFALAEAGEVPYDLALNLSSYLIVEEDYVPWEVASRIFLKLVKRLKSSLSYVELQAYIQNIISLVYKSLTWRQSKTSILNGLLQTRILSLAAYADLPDAKTWVQRTFVSWLNAKGTADTFEIEPDLRDVVYYHGMKSASMTEWEKLWEIYIGEKDVQEITKLMQALAAPRNVQILKQYLKLAWDENNVRSQDYLTVIQYIAANDVGTPLVWAHVRRHWPDLVARFSLNNRYLGQLISAITADFDTQEQLTEMLAFFSKFPEAGAGENARRSALERVRQNIRWASIHRTVIERWLEACPLASHDAVDPVTYRSFLSETKSSITSSTAPHQSSVSGFSRKTHSLNSAHSTSPQLTFSVDSFNDSSRHFIAPETFPTTYATYTVNETDKEKSPTAISSADFNSSTYNKRYPDKFVIATRLTDIPEVSTGTSYHTSDSYYTTHQTNFPTIYDDRTTERVMITERVMSSPHISSSPGPYTTEITTESDFLTTKSEKTTEKDFPTTKSEKTTEKVFTTTKSEKTTESEKSSSTLSNHNSVSSSNHRNHHHSTKTSSNIFENDYSSRQANSMKMSSAASILYTTEQKIFSPDITTSLDQGTTTRVNLASPQNDRYLSKLSTTTRQSGSLTATPSVPYSQTDTDTISYTKHPNMYQEPSKKTTQKQSVTSLKSTTSSPATNEEVIEKIIQKLYNSFSLHQFSSSPTYARAQTTTGISYPGDDHRESISTKMTPDKTDQTFQLQTTSTAEMPTGIYHHSVDSRQTNMRDISPNTTHRPITYTLQTTSLHHGSSEKNIPYPNIHETFQTSSNFLRPTGNVISSDFSTTNPNIYLTSSSSQTMTSGYNDPVNISPDTLTGRGYKRNVSLKKSSTKTISGSLNTTPHPTEYLSKYVNSEASFDTISHFSSSGLSRGDKRNVSLKKSSTITISGSLNTTPHPNEYLSKNVNSEASIDTISNISSSGLSRGDKRNVSLKKSSTKTISGSLNTTPHPTEYLSKYVNSEASFDTISHFSSSGLSRGDKRNVSLKKSSTKTISGSLNTTPHPTEYLSKNVNSEASIDTISHISSSGLSRGDKRNVSLKKSSTKTISGSLNTTPHPTEYLSKYVNSEASIDTISHISSSGLSRGDKRNVSLKKSSTKTISGSLNTTPHPTEYLSKNVNSEASIDTISHISSSGLSRGDKRNVSLKKSSTKTISGSLNTTPHPTEYLSKYVNSEASIDNISHISSSGLTQVTFPYQPTDPKASQDKSTYSVNVSKVQYLSPTSIAIKSRAISSPRPSFSFIESNPKSSSSIESESSDSISAESKTSDTSDANLRSSRELQPTTDLIAKIISLDTPTPGHTTYPAVSLNTSPRDISSAFTHGSKSMTNEPNVTPSNDTSYTKVVPLNTSQVFLSINKSSSNSLSPSITSYATTITTQAPTSVAPVKHDKSLVTNLRKAIISASYTNNLTAGLSVPSAGNVISSVSLNVSTHNAKPNNMNRKARSSFTFNNINNSTSTPQSYTNNLTTGLSVPSTGNVVSSVSLNVSTHNAKPNNNIRKARSSFTFNNINNSTSTPQSSSTFNTTTTTTSTPQSSSTFNNTTTSTSTPQFSSTFNNTTTSTSTPLDNITLFPTNYSIYYPTSTKTFPKNASFSTSITNNTLADTTSLPYANTSPTNLHHITSSLNHNDFPEAIVYTTSTSASSANFISVTQIPQHINTLKTSVRHTDFVASDYTIRPVIESTINRTAAKTFLPKSDTPNYNDSITYSPSSTNFSSNMAYKATSLGHTTIKSISPIDIIYSTAMDSRFLDLLEQIPAVFDAFKIKFADKARSFTTSFKKSDISYTTPQAILLENYASSTDPSPKNIIFSTTVTPSITKSFKTRTSSTSFSNITPVPTYPSPKNIISSTTVTPSITKSFKTSTSSTSFSNITPVPTSHETSSFASSIKTTHFNPSTGTSFGEITSSDAVRLTRFPGVIPRAVSSSASPHSESTSATFPAASSRLASSQPANTNTQHYSPSITKVMENLPNRLSTKVKPMNYNIILNPNLDSGTFSGNIDITVEVNEKRDNIVLHSQFLDIGDIKVFHDKIEVPIAEFVTVIDLEKLIVTFKNALVLGIYHIIIDFNGDLSRNLVGLYTSNLKDNRTILASKFQPTYARQAFPCFDEPQFKATFDITMVKPKNLLALSNMNIKSLLPHGNNTDIVTFASSVPMSTYLACFVICDFDYKEDEVSTLGIGYNFKIRSYAQRHQLHKIDFAQDIGKRAIEFYIKYFKVPYHLPKLDMIAIPDYISGATEHWGIVTYRETSFLVDEEEASTQNKISVANTIAHELAHMWLGNLVTCKWWDEIWLNEGFATYLQFKALETIEPSWNMMDQFVLLKLQPALKQDSINSSHPLIHDVSTADEITALFDTITYSKGASILRMFDNLIGAKKFQQGLTDYIKKHEYGNTVTKDFIAALQSHFEHDMGKHNFTKVVDSWTKQLGYPLLTVEEGPNKILIITQSKFQIATANRTIHDLQANPRWNIPITFTTNKGENSDVIWFMDTSDAVDIELDPDEKWIKLNNNQFGYYRVTYSLNMWNNLIDELKNNKVTELSSLDRANLLDDVFALAEANIVSYDLALNLSEYLVEEDDYVPWATAASIFTALSKKLRNTEAFYLLQAFVQSLLMPLYKNMSWKDTEMEVVEGLLRTKILTLATHFELRDAENVVERLFKQWLMAGSNETFVIDPDLREIVYTYGMKNATMSEWDQLWEIYLIQDDPQELAKLRKALASPRNAQILEKYLELARDESNIRSQDYLFVLQDVAANPVGSRVVWDYVRRLWPELVKRYSLNNRYLGNLIPAITAEFNKLEEFEEMVAFFSEHPESGAGKTGRIRAQENVWQNIRWVTHHLSTVQHWLEEQSTRTNTEN